jgi:hypothetical protein
LRITVGKEVAQKIIAGEVEGFAGTLQMDRYPDQVA